MRYSIKDIFIVITIICLFLGLLKKEHEKILAYRRGYADGIEFVNGSKYNILYKKNKRGYIELLPVTPSNL